MDPFGAMPVTSVFELTENTPQDFTHEQDVLRGPASVSKASIEYSPPKKLWHRVFDLTVTIKDRETISNIDHVHFYYGGEDVTKRVLQTARIKLSSNAKEIQFFLPAFRLLPEQDKQLVVTYAKLDPLGFDQVIGKVYEEPTCPMNELQSIATDNTLKGFNAKAETVDRIRALSMINQMNPALIAGLIAQESSFNPKAVSHAKAIGLTQITNLAEHHVLDDLGERAETWPRYPGLSDLDPISIKALIALGKINDQNEWRLSDEHSIQGGISYLKYIYGYWNTFSPLLDRKLASLKNRTLEQEKVDLILASYNSGPYRVRKNLERLGLRWLEANDLGEARKYVHNVKSYCYDFARGF